MEPWIAGPVAVDCGDCGRRSNLLLLLGLWPWIAEPVAVDCWGLLGLWPWNIHRIYLLHTRQREDMRQRRGFDNVRSAKGVTEDAAPNESGTRNSNT